MDSQFVWSVLNLEPLVIFEASKTYQNVVRKSHYHVFVGVVDLGQAPPEPWEGVETNT